MIQLLDIAFTTIGMITTGLILIVIWDMIKMSKYE